MADKKNTIDESDGPGPSTERRAGQGGSTNLMTSQADIDRANKAAAAGQPVGASARYKNGKLTLAGMQAVIEEGGSVSHGANTISSVGGLPSEAELAEGDENAERAALDNLDRQQSALDAQRARLTGGGRQAGTKPQK